MLTSLLAQPGTFGSRPADPSWSSAFNLIYWYLLRYSGDRANADKVFPSLRDYVDFMLALAKNDTTGLLRWSTTGDWLEQEFPSGSSNHHVKVRDQMTSAFNTILGVKVLADAASTLGRSADAGKYSAVLADQKKRFHATFYNMTAEQPVDERCGRFVHPQLKGCKKCANTGCCCPYAQFPGGCTFWQSKDDAAHGADGKLHMVTSCAAYPAACGAKQKPCWPDFMKGRPMHELSTKAMLGIKLSSSNFSCDLPTACTIPAAAVAAPTYGDGSQAALAYAIFLEAAPTAALHAATVAQLVAKLKEQSVPTTGIIATKWLPEALSGHAGAGGPRSDAVLDLVLQEQAPGWMDQISHNATTVWEVGAAAVCSWCGYASAHPPRQQNWEWMVGPFMNSHAHPALTSIGAWLWRYLAGIRIAENAAYAGYADGYAFVTFAPYASVATDHERVSSASATLPTERGNVSLQWEWQAGKLRIAATLPANSAGEVLIPKGAWSRLSEGGRTIWLRNSSGAGDGAGQVLGAEGVGGVRERAEGGLRAPIGSGRYEFLVE